MLHNKDHLAKEINLMFNLEFPEKITFDQLQQKLSEQIGYLIQSDFQKLVSILYQVDVNEEKLKSLLKENPGEDAAGIIADLVIERQIQKIKSRKKFHQDDKNISDDEKW